MNKVLKPLAILAFILSFSAECVAQTSLLITTNREAVFSPDTAACFGDPLMITATVMQMGPDSLPVSFSLMMRTPLGVFMLDSATVGGPASDSTNITIVDTYSASRFGGGGNIIVIWPESGFFPPADSIRDTVYVLCPTGSEESGSNATLIAFPNPSLDGVFHLQARGSSWNQCTMLVRDAAGRVVREYASFQSSLDLSDLPHGLYHLSVMDRQKPPVHLKLIR